MNYDAQDYRPDVIIHGNARITIYLAHYDAALLTQMLNLVDHHSEDNVFSKLASMMYLDLAGKVRSCPDPRVALEYIPIFPWSLHPHIRKHAERDDHFQLDLAEFIRMRHAKRAKKKAKA